MADNPLRTLHDCGQSVWNDFIARDFLEQGGLQQLIDNDGLTGITSNPTIFQKAIGSGSTYDQQLKELAQQGMSTEDIFQHLASSDVQHAADILRPVYDRTGGADGFVSIEVSPDAAHDTQRTLDDAHTLLKLVDRPNVMIKVPATPEGLPAIEQLTFEGTNVNITLIFAVEVYEQVMEAYLRGLERRAEAGQPLDCVASVASFFVSRVDTLVDKLLEDRRGPADLAGKAAVANAKIAYQQFQEVFGGERFQQLKAKGARCQRPLWASTSTKNPQYPDVMYVVDLVGPDTVNTMPPETIDAVREHGQIRCGTVMEDVEGAHRLIENLRGAGINMTDVTEQLTSEGVQKFQDSLHSLFKTIEEKSGHVLAQSGSR